MHINQIKKNITLNEARATQLSNRYSLHEDENSKYFMDQFKKNYWQLLNHSKSLVRLLDETVG